MKAVFKKEFLAYFQTPLGYVFIAAYYLLGGYFFFNYNLYGNTSDMRALFSTLFTVTLFLIPVLTMRLFAEDKKQKTDQLLRMAPVTPLSIVLGKFFAAMAVYIIGIGITLIMAIILSVISMPDWSIIVGHFIGLLLLGSALISICMLISALTENQIIAAVGGFCVGFFLMLLNSVAAIFADGFISKFILGISFQQRYTPFTLGMLNFGDIFYFVSVIALFVFFTVLAFDKRKGGEV